MNDAQESKQRDRVVVQNESARHMRADLRLGISALIAAAIIGSIAFGWLFAR